MKATAVPAWTDRLWTGCAMMPMSASLDVILILSPDRLARRYAYQVLLVEELERWGCEVIFLERPLKDNPEDRLL
jgi:DNA invertase Pin-like site-specific DNA recombinase